MSHRNHAQKILVALSFCVATALGARAHAAGDITSVTSDLSPHAPFTAAGDIIEFNVSLAGTFVLTNTAGGTLEALPELRLVVNGTNGAATLYALSPKTLGGTVARTDVTFRYVVKPGDMAQPLKIWAPPTEPYQFNWRGWDVCDASTRASAVWRFNPSLSLPMLGEVYDLDLAKANLVIQTLSFDGSDCEQVVLKNEAGHDWRVASPTPAGTEPVDFYVWTSSTQLVQVGSAAGQPSLLVVLPAGASSVEFPVKGLAAGTADIYLQRPQDYANNGTLGVTNYVKRTLTVTETPVPWVRLILPETGTDTVTMNETNALNTGRFVVELSEAFAADVDVRIDLEPAGQTYVSFSAAPLTVRIPAGQVRSSEQAFSVPDGNVTSLWGVTMSPVITNADAAAHFADRKGATVYVQNVRPSVAGWPQSLALSGVPCDFEWLASDVAADLASGMKVTWNFNGETVTNVTGAAGTVQHTFATAGMKLVRVTATDKDGLSSATASFFLIVEEPPPPPSVFVAPSERAYSETTTNNTGSLLVYLSDPYPSDVWVQLSATLQGQAQSNIALTAGAIRIPVGSISSAPVTFSIPDGTPDSELLGVDIVATVTNPPASEYFTSIPNTVFIRNVAPSVAQPAARDPLLAPLPPYTNVPLGRPFAFEYAVHDATPDLSSMAVRWNFGDGTSETVVTGAAGSVSHTFGSLGIKTVTVRATDKDGGASEIAFPVCVVPAVGFAEWAAARGMSGDPHDLFTLDRNGDGVANGFEYLFGNSLTNGVPLLAVRLIDGVPVVETPNRDPEASPDAAVTVEACTNLPAGLWTVPMGPYSHAAKPADRDWYAPLTAVPNSTFFRLRADLE